MAIASILLGILATVLAAIGVAKSKPFTFSMYDDRGIYRPHVSGETLDKVTKGQAASQRRAARFVLWGPAAQIIAGGLALWAVLSGT